MTTLFATEFSKEWIDAWNSHNLAEILSHYSDDIEITTPMIRMALGENSGTLNGKAVVADYWKRALEKLPDLHFELYAIAEGVDSLILYYKSVMNRNAMEAMFFNEEGKVCKMIAHYTN